MYVSMGIKSAKIFQSKVDKYNYRKKSTKFNIVSTSGVNLAETRFSRDSRMDGRTDEQNNAHTDERGSFLLPPPPPPLSGDKRYKTFRTAYRYALLEKDILLLLCCCFRSTVNISGHVGTVS